MLKIFNSIINERGFSSIIVLLSKGFAIILKKAASGYICGASEKNKMRCYVFGLVFLLVKRYLISQFVV